MAWKVCTEMEERLAFVRRWEGGDERNFSKLCMEFGISRKTGYKWLERYEEKGEEGLEGLVPGRRKTLGEALRACADKAEDPRGGPPGLCR